MSSQSTVLRRILPGNLKETEPRFVLRQTIVDLDLVVVQEGRYEREKVMALDSPRNHQYEASAGRTSELTI